MLCTNLLTTNESQNFHHEQYGTKMNELQEEEDREITQNLLVPQLQQQSPISPL